MFVQVIRGKASDTKALREAGDRWMRELAPGAEGWLGSTIGVAADGTFVAVARFTDAEAAKRNSDRPEQGAWWEQTSENLSDVTFADSTDIEVFGRGGSDDAGFVQVMFGSTRDEAKVRNAGALLEEFIAQRPELIGGITVWLGGGRHANVAYFTSEADARAGESKELPEDLKARYTALMSAIDEIEYIDLGDPWTYGP